MISKFSFKVGFRYLRAKNKNGFLSFISTASLVGIALGVAVIIIVMSVMNGFTKAIRKELLQWNPHVSIKSDQPITNWQLYLDSLNNIKGVKSASPIVYTNGLISGENLGSKGVIVTGLESKSFTHLYPIDDVEGLKANKFNAVISNSLAKALNLNIGDKFTLVIPEFNVSVLGITPRMRRFTVDEIIDSKKLQIPNQIFINIEDAKRLLKLENAVSEIHIKLDNEFDADRISFEILPKLDSRDWVTNWTLEYSNYFAAIKLEKTVMFLILSLILAIAAFNIVTSLVMSVNEKIKSIAIMRVLGCKPSEVLGIFITQGVFLGILGTIIGVSLGVFITINLPAWFDWLQASFGLDLIPKGIYGTTRLPTELLSTDVLNVSLAALLLSFLSTLYPAYKAYKILPAEALRYE